VFWFSVSVFLTYKTHGRWNLRTRVVSVGGTPRKRKLLAMFGVGSEELRCGMAWTRGMVP